MKRRRLLASLPALTGLFGLKTASKAAEAEADDGSFYVRLRLPADGVLSVAAARNASFRKVRTEDGFDLIITAIPAASPPKNRRREKPSPDRKPVRNESTDTFLERLTVGASEKNNWFGYGSEEAFERAARDSIPAGD